MHTEGSKLDQREEIMKGVETRKEPSQFARDLLRRGEGHVEQLKAQIEDLMGELAWDPGQEAAVIQLQMIQKELDQAYEEMRDKINLAGTENLAGDPWLEALDESDKAFATGRLTPRMAGLLETPDGERAFRQNLDDAIRRLQGNDTDFATLKRLCALAKSDPKVGDLLTTEMKKEIGRIAWARLMDDDGYMSGLERVRTDLGSVRGGRERPLCRELGLAQLVLLHELFGNEPAEMAKHMDLATYCQELELDSGEMLVTPTVLEDKGYVVGSVSVLYQYGEKKDDARMHRHFSSKLIETDEGLAMEKTTTLELITLPDRVKSNNTAKQEMASTNGYLKRQGFSKEKLHANIDIGGYAWAAMGFGWDVDAMRQESRAGKSDFEVIKEFVVDRIETVEAILKGSDIDPGAPDIKKHFDELRQRLADPLGSSTVTPFELSKLGKDGPSFVLARSGRYYRTEEYPQHQSADPPAPSVKGAQHLGKLLLIGSDWYGQKPL